MLPSSSQLDAGKAGESSHRPHQKFDRGEQPEPASHYTPIQPRGDPNEHRQVMAEEKELENSQVLSMRRCKNAAAAARMRERQREKERALLRCQCELVARERQLKAELSALRGQREQHEAEAVGRDYDLLFSRLSNELHDTSTAMRHVSDDIQSLLEIVKSLDV